MKLPLIYEDDDLLVVDKLPGIVVNRAESVKKETVQDWAEDYIKIKKPLSSDYIHTAFYQRSGIAHRLDKDTSGVLLIAKNPLSLASLLSQFKKRTIVKTYQTLVYGLVRPKEGAVNVPIGRLPHDRYKFGISIDGRSALTNYSAQRYFEDTDNSKKYTLLYVYPKTGRTHQIRVHLSYIHHPIVGDSVYNSKKHINNTETIVPRIFLHACKIAIMHPVTEKHMEFTSPLPLDLTTALSLLREVPLD